jgi:hypothetical protein
MFAIEIWQKILSCLYNDVNASFNLLCVIPELEKDKNLQYWIDLEKYVSWPFEYYLFCKYFKFMGTRKRIQNWIHFLQSNCFLCKTNLHNVCPRTYCLKTKLCWECRKSELISEYHLCKMLPYYLILYIRQNLNYCWLPDEHVGTCRFFSKKQLSQFITTI